MKNKRKWFEVKNQTNNSSDLYFYGDIVSSEWQKWEESDTSANDIRDYLNSVNENTRLNIFINSAGGVVTTGVAIYNMLKRHKGEKHVYVDGIAASIASIIAFAGDYLYMPKSSYLMVHLPLVNAFGNKNDLQIAINTLETIESNMMEIYYDNLRDEKDKEKIKAMVENETWLTGSEASELFNIELIKETEAIACASDLLSQYVKTPNTVVARSIENPLNQQKVSDEEILKLQNELDLLTL